MQEYIGCCVDNPFKDVEELTRIIDESKQIGRTRFLSRCDINEELKHMMYIYPHDFEYYHNLKEHVCFYTHSMIEYFFQ